MYVPLLDPLAEVRPRLNPRTPTSPLDPQGNLPRTSLSDTYACPTGYAGHVVRGVFGLQSPALGHVMLVECHFRPQLPRVYAAPTSDPLRFPRLPSHSEPALGVRDVCVRVFLQQLPLLELDACPRSVRHVAPGPFVFRWRRAHPAYPPVRHVPEPLHHERSGARLPGAYVLMQWSFVQNAAQGAAVLEVL